MFSITTVQLVPEYNTTASTPRFSLGEVRYSYTRRWLHPSRSGRSFVTFTGHFASGLQIFHAAARASSAVFASASTSATHESPSGASRIVALPFTRIVQSFGATNVLPSTVVLGVSAVSFSDAVSVAARFAKSSEDLRFCAESSANETTRVKVKCFFIEISR